MKNLEDIVGQVQSKLEEKDTVREIAIKSSRAVIRLAGSVVHGIHKKADMQKELGEALEEAERLQSLLQDHMEIWHSGIVQDALQELAEAAIVTAIVKGEPLPFPDDINVPAPAYLMGLADSIGELRRFALEALRQGRAEGAEQYLEMMEEMFLVIMRFDYPEAIVAIRRKQDIARSILEKTRGDVAVAVSATRLERRMADLDDKLKK